MINFRSANKFCKDNLSLIENYDKAINDKTQTWDCHHRLETELNVFKQQLIDMEKYYDVQAYELIFLTKSDHMKMYHTGKHHSEETKRKQSDALKGKPAPWNAHHKSEETKKKISDSLKGESHPMYSKHHSEETKKKQSYSHKGKPAPNKGKHRVYRDDGTFYMSF